MNRQGSALISVLIVLAVIFSLSVYSIQSIGPLQSIRQNENLSVAREGLTTSLKMMYRAKGRACMPNLIQPNVLGTSFNNFISKTNSGTLVVPIGLPSGVGAPLMLSQDSEYEGLNVTKISLTNVRKVSFKIITLTPQIVRNSMLWNLTFSLLPKGGGIAMSAVVPFYFISDGGGNIQDCYATSYSQPGVTSEDHLCVLNYGAGRYYNPIDSNCI